MNMIETLRKYAETLDESVLTEEQRINDIENDEEFLKECTAALLPTIIQMELMENADQLDEDVKDAFLKVQDYMVGQGYISEAATVNLNNPKISVVKLSRQSQIARLKTIISLKMARKNNDPKYKKYKIGAKIKKDNLADIITKYGSRAEKLAKKMYEQNRKNRKVSAVVTEKKEKAKK